MEEEQIWQEVDVTTTYHILVSKLDVNMWSLLDIMRINKRANGEGSVMWADVVAICRYQFLGVALVPSSVTGDSNSTLNEISTLGSIGLSSSNGVVLATLAGQVVYSKLSTIGPI